MTTTRDEAGKDFQEQEREHRTAEDAMRATLARLRDELAAAERERWREIASLTHQLEQAIRERDELQAKLDAELPAAWREDLASLNECLERVSRERDEARAEVERLRAERRQLRARLVECRPWVGVCPLEPEKINEVYAVRDLADHTLEEVKP